MSTEQGLVTTVGRPGREQRGGVARVLLRQLRRLVDIVGGIGKGVVELQYTSAAGLIIVLSP